MRTIAPKSARRTGLQCATLAAMGNEDAPLVEVLSARCVECGQPIAADDFSDGEFDQWPIVMEGAVIGHQRLHRGCGGHVELGEVKPAWHFCDENCECGSGGLPGRVG